jgi:hypothetical protein
LKGLWDKTLPHPQSLQEVMTVTPVHQPLANFILATFQLETVAQGKVNSNVNARFHIRDKSVDILVLG